MLPGNHWTPVHKYLHNGDIFDYGECGTFSHILTYLYISIAVILFISVICLLVIFIHKDIRHPMAASLFYLGISFGFISMSLIPLSIRNILMVCHHHIVAEHTRDLLSWFGILYHIQIYLLWLILFMRLHIATMDGMYQFNKYIILSFKIIFSLCPILTILYIIYLIIHEFIHKISPEFNEGSHLFISIFMVLLIMIFSVIIPIILTVLFTSKLMSIYKEINRFRDLEEQRKHDKLIPVITRTTILAMISVSITVLTMISLFIHVVFACYMGLLDIYSNFICIMFAYKHFHPCYHKICSPLDAKCRNICFNLMNNTENNTANQNSAVDADENEMFIKVDGGTLHSTKTDESLEEMYQETVECKDEDKIIELNGDEMQTNDDCFNEEIVENDGTNNNLTAHSVNSYAAYTESAQSTKISDIETATTSTE